MVKRQKMGDTSYKPYFRQPKGERDRKQSIGFNDGKWQPREETKYFKFLQQFMELFKDLKKRRKRKIFQKMSKAVMTRDAEQCRSHHQKMVLKFGDQEKVLEWFRTSQYAHKKENQGNMMEESNNKQDGNAVEAFLEQQNKLSTEKVAQELKQLEHSQQLMSLLQQVGISMFGDCEVPLELEIKQPDQTKQYKSLFDQILEDLSR